MKFTEIVSTAIGNAFRSRLRTTLTVLAIFVGAFTLTLTNGVGTGITSYIDSQVSSFGASDILLISQGSFGEGGPFGDAGSGPTEYDPDRTVMPGQMGGPQFEALGPADLETIRSIAGIESVDPVQMASPDYIQWNDGRRYEFTINPMPAGTGVDIVAGSAFPRDEESPQLLLPVSYLEPLGFSNSGAAVGQTVTVGVTDVLGNRHEVEANVAGVQEDTLLAFGLIASRGLIAALADAQLSGLPAAMTEIYPVVTAEFAAAADVEAIKAALAEAGYSGQTVADQMGAINTVINAIIAVLNAFAIIALIAAGFGIINTLYMSVQERTREIGLMKAMGMGRGGIFALFSTEAAFIGFLGSAIGSAAAIVLGTLISDAVARGPLSELAGLRVLAFDPLSVATVIVVVMLLAFLSGTLPAASAARLDPIEALRYE